MNIYKFIDPLFSTKELYDLYLKLMTPISPYMELDRRQTYYQLRFDTKLKPLRQYYNSVRGYDDPSDLDYYEKKYTKTYTLPTGTLFYFFIGNENGRTGDPNDYYHVYKFIPKDNRLYRNIEEKLFSTYSEMHSIEFSMMTPNTMLSWHTDEHFQYRYHHVLTNDAKTPSMIFKKPNEDQVEIPAKAGDVYMADVKIPHCVPSGTKTRLHLMACITGENFHALNGQSRHGFLMKENTTWADWKENQQISATKIGDKIANKERKWVTVKVWENEKLITKKILARKFNK